MYSFYWKPCCWDGYSVCLFCGQTLYPISTRRKESGQTPITVPNWSRNFLDPVFGLEWWQHYCINNVGVKKVPVNFLHLNSRLAELSWEQNGLMYTTIPPVEPVVVHAKWRVRLQIILCYTPAFYPIKYTWQNGITFIWTCHNLLVKTQNHGLQQNKILLQSEDFTLA